MTPHEYFRFLHRVARQYAYFWKKYGSDRSHLRREDLTASSIPVILKQLRPKTLLPHDGNVDEILKVVVPMLVHTFRMPTPGATAASAEDDGDAWADMVIERQEFSFHNDVQSRRVLMAHVAYLVKQEQDHGMKNGCPRKRGWISDYLFVTLSTVQCVNDDMLM